MSLADVSLNATSSTTPTGGTALALDSLGQTLGKNHLFFAADTDFRTRREMICTASQPRVQSSAPNGYTQARQNILLKVPLALDNGATTVNTASVQFAMDVETSDSEKDQVIQLIITALCDSNVVAFIKNGSTE